MEMLNHAISLDIIKPDEIYQEKILQILHEIRLSKNIMTKSANESISKVREKLEAFPEEKKMILCVLNDKLDELGTESKLDINVADVMMQDKKKEKKKSKKNN